nr:MAG: hypothetical protein 2 [Marnaviridae sp.]
MPQAVGYDWYKYRQFALQSADLTDAEAVVTSTQAGESTVVSQTVTFTDNEGGELFEAPTSDNVVAMVDNTDDIALGTFLSRPTPILNTTWTSANQAGVFTTFFPWQLFLSDPRIKRKIENYAFIRAKLHIKVLVNGTPFQYGSMRLCYEPLIGWVPSKVRTNPTSNLPLLNPYSQMPGFYINPQANAGGEMELPFFLHKNWMDLTSNAEVTNMGKMTLVTFAPLRVAVSGGTSSVGIRVYAWMTDVHLMGSTSKLTLQAKDEYGQGVISKPASALASMASLMTKVPYIGKFARATEIGATATSQIAAMFGFTNVPVISDVTAFNPMNGPMLASSHIGTPVQKLTLDPKQELSIDPAPHGIGSMDELSLTYLKTKESYFGQTSWATTDLTGTQLFNVRINPFLPARVTINNTVPAPVGFRVYHIPLSYIGAMFKNWRGDIIIRMKVVCTKFHKGRLKISYDPIGNISTTDPQENEVYTEILDIGENDDVELRIPYHQDTGWLNVDHTLLDNWTPGNALAPRKGIDNGTLTVRVLVPLTAPAASTVNLLFFARGADNFEFANPEEFIGSSSATETIPSFFALQAEDKTDVVATPIQMGTSTLTIPERYGLNFGEAVHSLRDLLHRSVVSDSVILPTGTAAKVQVLRKLYRRMPYTPGFTSGGVGTSANNVVAATGTGVYNFNGMHPMPYVTGMFMGYRGGTNYTVTASTDAYGFLDDFRVDRVTSSLGLTAATSYAEIASTSLAAGHSLSLGALYMGRGQFVRDGLSGQAITSNRTNASVCFQIPDYNLFNFSLVDPYWYNLGNTLDGTINQGALWSSTLKNTTAADNNQSTISIMSAAGAAPDFTCLYFICCPTLDFGTLAPAPT